MAANLNRKPTHRSSARIIDGKAIAAEMRESIAAAAAALKRDHGVVPTLAAVLVGDDPASHVYVRAKTRQAEDAGLRTTQRLLPADTSEAHILDLIASLGGDDSVDAILVQLPLPAHVDKEKVLASLDPAKDVDGFHPVNVGRLWSEGDGMVPCTPHGCMTLLRRTIGDVAGKNAVVIGRSNIVGKPLAALLLRANATVTLAHSKSGDLSRRCRDADILIAAVGRPHMVQGDWIKPGAAVVDVGINRIPDPDGGVKADGTTKTRIVGDVDFEAAQKIAGWITPVPGGVGPMTIACLMRNTVIAACRRRGLVEPDL